MPLTKSLSTYTNEKIAVLGKLTEQVEYEKPSRTPPALSIYLTLLSVVVIKGEGPSLLS